MIVTVTEMGDGKYAADVRRNGRRRVLRVSGRGLLRAAQGRGMLRWATRDFGRGRIGNQAQFEV